MCENALIHGYARQSRSITPEIITEIAVNFRLNVEHPSTAGQSTRGDRHAVEVQEAAMTLLDLYAHLRNAQKSETDLRATGGEGARKNEPYI